jgi:hypothetical protein
MAPRGPSETAEWEEWAMDLTQRSGEMELERPWDRPQRGELFRLGRAVHRAQRAALGAVPGGILLSMKMDEDGWPIEVYVERSDGRVVIVELSDRHPDRHQSD